MQPNVIATEIALNSLTISWDTFSHDACGDIIYGVRLSNGVQLVVEKNTTNRSMDFTGLNSTTQYEVSVYATNNAGRGPSTKINVTTLTPSGNIVFISSFQQVREI